jgi:hypothetical protein
MRKLTLITALHLATSPVAAQSRQQALGAGGQTNNAPLPDTPAGNDRDVLQPTHQPEHRRRRFEPRVHIERRVGNELRVRDERRSRKQHFVHLTLRKLSAG